jgi:CxxC motif-containing protein
MEIVCIMCGAACALEVKEKKGLLEVKGNICRRGGSVWQKGIYQPPKDGDHAFSHKRRWVCAL